MKMFKFLLLLVIFLLFITVNKAQLPGTAKANDTLTLAQAFINLSLTETYFDTLSLQRVDKILAFEHSELSSLNKESFKDNNALVYNLSWSMLYLSKAKRLSKITNSPNRTQLLQWKSVLDSVYLFFNEANIYWWDFDQKSTDGYNELIGLNKDVYNKFTVDISKVDSLFSTYFNKDIYPDFQRIFFTAKSTNVYYLDSLKYFASLYDLNLQLEILNRIPEVKKKFDSSASEKTNSGSYRFSLALSLMVEYLQFSYLASEAVSPGLTFDRQEFFDWFQNFRRKVKPENKESFKRDDNIIAKDDFFNKEINTETLNNLYDKLKEKFARNMVIIERFWEVLPVPREDNTRTKYYFPNPAPFPSAAVYVNNFKPAFKTARQVDDFLAGNLNTAGYNNQLHYYYVKSGFAITTSLEKINTDGSPVAGSARWNISTSGNASFSLYQIFKSIFFETESHFRMFAFVVAPNRPAINNSPTSLAGMQDLIKFSYPSLPNDIENDTINTKVLSILVYHFLQSDIGEVPMLERKDPIPVKTHLTKSKLGALLVP